MTIYAIGDVHGQLDLLRHAHDLVARDGGTGAVIVHVGDLVDRGPDSRGVIQHLIDGQAAGRPWAVVKGNHDRLMSKYLDDPGWLDPGLSTPVPWVQHHGLGAATTLQSYGVDPAARDVHARFLAAVPAAHRVWLRGLPTSYLHPRALFVHAGIRPGVDLYAQTEDDLVWIRKPFLHSPADHGILVVHGHSPVEKATHYGNRLNIDTGAAYGGPLSVVKLDDNGVWLLTDSGAEPLEPFSEQGFQR